MSMVRRGSIRASVSVIALAALSSVVWAQAAEEEAGKKKPTAMDEITVTADRVQSTVYDSAATVSVTDDKKIDRDNINGPRDLVRDEPGVSVGNQPGRGGSSSYTIRGIGYNRVRIQIDDIKIPDFPGSNINTGNYTRDFVDFDSLKQVEIIRGPSSALFGSDAIGGVVSYVTKDPSDYLIKPDKNWYLSGKIGYDSSDLSKQQTLTGAFRQGDWEGLLLYTHRRGHELRPNTEEQANSQRYEAHNILGKIIYNAGDWGRFRLTGEFAHKTTGTNLLTEAITSGGARGMPYTRVFNSTGEDTMTRPRISLDWTKPLDWAIADTVKTSAYWTEVRRDDSTIQYRGSGMVVPVSPSTLRDSDNGFHQEIKGGDIQFTADRELWDWQHTITYGGSVDITTSSRPRDRYEYNLLTGAITKSIAGEVYPNKNWPDTRTTQGGVYIQDIMQFGKLRLIPALRYDYYHLEPHPDAAFANSNSKNFTIESQTHHAVSPKFGATYDLLDWLRVYGQYSHGFRAPPYDNANFGFTNSVSRYEILPNGNLKPEKSNGFEVGFKGKLENGSSFQLSGFYNLYNDFIDTRVVGTTATGLTQFQYQNISKVRIWGFEAKGDWRLTDEWSVFGSLAYARGEDEDTKIAVDSVDPLSFTAGVRYKNLAGWGGELRARGAAKKKRVSDDSYLKPGGYAVLDAQFFYDYSENLSFNVGVYNIFDKEYYNSQDVVGLAADNKNVELYRSPGRTIAVNATVRW